MLFLLRSVLLVQIFIVVIQSDLFCFNRQEQFDFLFEQFHYQEQIQKFLISNNKSSKDCGVVVRVDYQQQRIQIKFDIGRNLLKQTFSNLEYEQHISVWTGSIFINTQITIDTETMMSSNETYLELLYICSSSSDCASQYSERLLNDDYNRQWFFSIQRYIELQGKIANNFVPSSSQDIEDDSRYYLKTPCSTIERFCQQNSNTDKKIRICLQTKINMNYNKLIERMVYKNNATNFYFPCNLYQYQSKIFLTNLTNIIKQENYDFYLISNQFFNNEILSTTTTTTNKNHLQTLPIIQTRSTTTSSQLSTYKLITTSYYLSNTYTDTTSKSYVYILKSNYYLINIVLVVTVDIKKSIFFIC